MTMYRLRYPWLWLGLAWALVALVVAGSLLPPRVLRGLDSLVYDKAQHALAYGVVMVCFAGIYQGKSLRWIVPGLLAMGVGIEFLQLKYFHRDFDLKDMLANAVGVAAGLALAYFALAGWCARLETWWEARGADRSDGG
jgi:hypothetical protein